MKKVFLCLFLSFIPMMIGGCASIVSKSNQSVVVSTEPNEAELVIKDSKGWIVYKGKTPSIVTLPKSDGSYFGGETYEVYLEKEGYSSQVVVIESNISGWYLFGNFFFGGLIGWFIVDPLTGAMYKLEPNKINKILTLEKVKEKEI